MSRIKILVSILALGQLVAPAVDPLDEEKPPPKPAVKEVRPGVFQVGDVLREKSKQQISFPVLINMDEGLIEYILVTGKGKTHESLLVTRTEPYHIHVAMLLLGAKGAAGKVLPEDPREPIPGEPISIELSWKKKGNNLRAPVEQFVRNRHLKKPMKPGPFVYNGSIVFEGMFIAHRDGNLFSLITAPAALANNPRMGRHDDENWEAIKKGLPPLDGNATLTVKLLNPMAKLMEMEKRDKDGNIVGQPEEGLWFKRGEPRPYSGVVAGHYKSGQMESSRVYEKGIQVGTETHWYDNGKTRLELIYKGGKVTSLRQWDADGKEQRK